MRACFVTLLLLCPLWVNAADVVTVRYLDGYPPPNMSTEWINLRVTRLPASAAAVEKTKEEVDRFFDKVAAVLADNGVTKNWQLAIPDAPAIEITIDLDGKKVMLVSCHTVLEAKGNYLITERGGEMVTGTERTALLAKQSESFRRHRLAFEEILRLTVERSRARLSP